MKNNLIPREETTARQPGLALFVVFTTVQDTLRSLQAVDQLTSDLATRIHLLVPDNAESSAALITPAMLADFTARYFLTMIPHTSNVKIKLTHYPAATENLWEVLPPGSLIVLAGTTHRFWPSPEQRFARQLQHAGHEVLFFSTQSLEARSSISSETEIKPGKKSLLDSLKLFFLPSNAAQNRS